MKSCLRANACQPRMLRSTHWPFPLSAKFVLPCLPRGVQPNEVRVMLGSRLLDLETSLGQAGAGASAMLCLTPK